MEELLNSFGQTIKDARIAAGMTQDALAEQAGVTQDIHHIDHVLARLSDTKCIDIYDKLRINMQARFVVVH